MKKLLITLAILLFVIIGGVKTFIAVAGRDIQPPDVTDLVPERIELPAEQNAFTFFVLATNSFYWPSDASLVTGYLDGKPAADNLVQEIITRNTNMMLILGKGLECQRCLAPEVPRLDSDITYLYPWRNMARVMAIKSRHDRLSGRYADSASTCISLLRYGDLIQKDAQCTIHYLVGIAVLGLGFTQAQDLARDRGTPPAERARLADALASLGRFDEGLVRAIKMENKVMARTIDQLRDGKRGTNEFLAGWVQEHIPGLWRSAGSSGYVFQPNRTKVILAEFYRDMIKNTALPYGRMTRHDMDEQLGLKGSTARRFARPNAVGRTLCGLLTPSSESVLERRCRTECDLSATRLIVACNAYLQKSGKLPEDLQSLTPLYLDSVPVDPYDGGLFRYVPARGLIYSVGKDLKDSGGSARLRGEKEEDFSPQRRSETDDIVFLIKSTTEPRQDN